MNTSARVLVQVCPNDHPPFLDLCRVYSAAAVSLGLQPITVILGPPFAAAAGDFDYLGIRNLKDTRRLGSTLAGRVGELLDGREPLVVLCHRYRAYRAARAARLHGGRSVTIAHEFGFFRRRRRRVARRLFAPNVRFAGVSPAVVADLETSVERPLLLPNGIDLARLDSTRLAPEAARVTLGIDPGPFTIALTGRLLPVKRPELALEAFAAAVSRMPGAQLVLIGDGPMAPRLAERAATLPVRLAGFVPDARRCLSAVDLALVTSSEREAFNMTALEAMASGVPVLAGPMPGPRSVLGKSGIYYQDAGGTDLSTSLIAAYRDHCDGRLAALAQAGIQRAEQHFSVAAVARNLDTVLFENVC